MDGPGPVENWRDADAYVPLLAADRSFIAWEWLRRDPAYRLAVACGTEAGAGAAGSERWALHRFEDPALTVPDARPFWRASRHPSVLSAVARVGRAAAEMIDLPSFGCMATRIPGEKGRGEHWLVTDGLRAIRLDLLKGSAAAGPVELQFLLTGRTSVTAPLLALRRLLALAQHGAFSRGLHPPEASARRWVMMLRAYDALAGGANQREIAAELLSDAAGGERWRVNASSVRSQVQRLVRAARQFGDGGYRTLLR
jgi:hypothetical protein